MAGVELLSDQGFRIDGRRPGELRRVQCKMGVFSQADGSSYLEQVCQCNVGMVGFSRDFVRLSWFVTSFLLL